MNRQAAVLMLALATAAPLATYAAVHPHVKRAGDDAFKRVVVGESQQQVRNYLGKPNTTSRRAGLTHYQYNYFDSWGVRSVFDVTFDANGRVAAKSEQRLQF